MEVWSALRGRPSILHLAAGTLRASGGPHRQPPEGACCSSQRTWNTRNQAVRSTKHRKAAISHHERTKSVHLAPPLDLARPGSAPASAAPYSTSNSCDKMSLMRRSMSSRSSPASSFMLFLSIEPTCSMSSNRSWSRSKAAAASNS